MCFEHVANTWKVLPLPFRGVWPRAYAGEGVGGDGGTLPSQRQGRVSEGGDGGWMASGEEAFTPPSDLFMVVGEGEGFVLSVARGVGGGSR